MNATTEQNRTHTPKTAARKIWAFHDGPMVGLFIGKEEVGTNIAGYVRSDIADELVAALQALVDACEKQPRISKAMPDSKSPLGLARATLAKATGAQP